MGTVTVNCVQMSSKLLLLLLLASASLASTINIVTQTTSCPDDSILVDGKCKCDHTLCKEPSCDVPRHLNQLTNYTDRAGQCCPKYSCDICPDDVIAAGNCSCGDEAFLNEKRHCECTDPNKSLSDGKCICDEDKCPLPQMCAKNSVAVKVVDGCCANVTCMTCPGDSYASHDNNEEIEAKCICYACKKEKCPEGTTARVVSKGHNFPGQCCDVFECISSACTVGNKTYFQGDTWNTSEGEHCHCEGGVSFCNSSHDSGKTFCHEDGTIYKNNEKWMQDACTQCTCNSGVPKCWAHLCDVVLDEVKERPCLLDDIIHTHLSTWATDGCTECTCMNGEVRCISHMCSTPVEEISKPQCPSMEKCGKHCAFGYKKNRIGCDICKCSKIVEEKWKYHELHKTLDDLRLSEDEAIEILRNYELKKLTTVATPVETCKIPDCWPYLLLLTIFLVAVFVAKVALKMKNCKKPADFGKKCTYELQPFEKKEAKEKYIYE